MKDMKGIGKSLFRTHEVQLRYSKENKELMSERNFDSGGFAVTTWEYCNLHRRRWKDSRVTLGEERPREPDLNRRNMQIYLRYTRLLYSSEFSRLLYSYT
ncbi:hypothetical protein PV325_001416 [Microctonus aethiopoides]|nr:hypothetical protein PV325_001416 [Microctonus aethiopoides]